LTFSSEAVALSGLTFIADGKEAELIYLIRSATSHLISLYLMILSRHGEETLVEAAVAAITQVLAKGGSHEHHKLMEADVFSVAMDLHGSPKQRPLGLKMLHGIVMHLGHAIILDSHTASRLLSLFE
jgi:hypothetical protein